EIRQLDWGVECRVGPERLWARLILLATGAESQLPRRLGFHLAAAGQEAVGIRCYIRSKARLRQAVASYDRELLPGFSWIVPLGDGDYNVGCILFEPADPGPVLQRFLETFPLARYLMSEQSRVGEPVAAPLRCGLPPNLPIADGRALLAGEAIYTTLPFTGEGVGAALESGLLAAEILDAALSNPDAVNGWRERINVRMGARYRTHEVAQRWLANRWLHELLCWRILRSSWMRGQVEGLLSDHGDPTHLCSWHAVFESFRH
ncbi:MAG TPA: NAD(P)/FAD-dependent oxidoreductase, partial [Candidatus Xenobia bacterium]